MSSGHSPTVHRAVAHLAATPLTYLLAAGCVATLVWVQAHGTPGDPATLVRFGALERGRVWSGEPWRLVTAAFLHFGWLHLALNVAGAPLYRVVERSLGPARFLAVYLASAVAASAASLLGHDTISAGASGAVFGLVGAMLSLRLRALGSWRVFLAGPFPWAVVLGFAVASVAGGLVLPLDHLSHLGGFAAGAAFAWLLSAPRPARPITWAAVGALAALAAAAAWPRPALSRLATLELERALHGALRARDVPEARRLVARADAGHDGSDRLRYYRALLLVQEDDLAGALEATRPLRAAGDPALRAEAAELSRSLARALAYRHSTGDGAARDRRLALAYMEEACTLGDAQSCRDARALSGE
jgi:rhomboid protease GluP